MLIALCTCIPLWFAYRRSRLRTGFEVNHVTLFTFGFLFYWILPFLVAPIAAEQAGETWSSLFYGIDQVQTYLATALASYIMFMIGDLLAARFLRQKTFVVKPLHTGVFTMTLLPLCAVALASIFMYRSLLFQPYAIDVDAERARGTIASCVVVLGSVALLYFSDRAHQRLTSLIKNRFVLAFLFGSVFLLYLGSRLYVMSFILMLLVYRSCFVQSISLRLLALIGSGVGLLSGLVGIFRISDTSNIFLNIVFEPMFTSFALLHFLNFERIPWIAAPKYLLGDLANLIPTVLFSGKADLRQFPEVYNPLGALHSFVSFAYNFGIIGTVLFMFCLPITLRWFRARSSSQLARVTYTMLSGWLAFSFFRDPFGVSLVKAMLEFSIIIPSILVGFGRILQHTVPVKGQQAPAGLLTMASVDSQEA